MFGVCEKDYGIDYGVRRNDYGIDFGVRHNHYRSRSGGVVRSASYTGRVPQSGDSHGQPSPSVRGAAGTAPELRCF